MESEVQQDRQCMYNVTLRYVRITIVTVETTMRCVWCATCHCEQYKNNECFAKKNFFLRIYEYVAGNTETYLSLHVNCPIYLLDFNEIWSFSADFHWSTQYQIPRKSITCSRTDTADRYAERRDEAYWRFLLFMRTRLCRWNSCCVVRVMPWRHIWEYENLFVHSQPIQQVRVANFIPGHFTPGERSNLTRIPTE
jgi:hypothetical protein